MLTASALRAEDTVVPQPDLQPLLSDLDSNRYTTRINASKALKALSSQELANMARLANDQSSAETVIRILAEIDNRYSVPTRLAKLETKDRPSVPSTTVANMLSASEALESLASENRVLVADGAEQSLREHADKRMDIALQKIQDMGAFIRLGAMPASPVGMGQRSSTNIMQILITKDWKGGDQGVEIFSRLTELFRADRNFGNRRNATSVRASVYMIDGNPLTDRQSSRLAELTGVGQAGLQRRSQVALGIVWDANPMFAFSTGVTIRDVSTGGSAEKAGLSPGDLLLAIESDDKTAPNPANLLLGQQLPIPGDDSLGGSRVPLRDFDDLVTRLQNYGKGDVIKLRVIRGARAYFLRARGIRLGAPDDEKMEEPKPEILDVKLKGWEELGREWKFPY